MLVFIFFLSFYKVTGVTDGLHGLLLSKCKIHSLTEDSATIRERQYKHPRQLAAWIIADKTLCIFVKDFKRSEKSSHGEKIKIFCCHIAVTYCQKAFCYDHSRVESDEKISEQGRCRGIWPHQGGAYLSLSQLSYAVKLLLYAACQWTCLMTSWRGNNRIIQISIFEYCPVLLRWSAHLIPITSSTNNEYSR